MNSIVFSFVSILAASHPATSPKTGHEVTVRSLTMQTDERAGKACSGGSTVIVYENAADMRGGK